MALTIGAAVGFLALTSPWTWRLLHGERAVAEAGPADLENGRVLLVAGDCATCHVSADEVPVEILTDGRAIAKDEGEPLLLGGGRRLDTQFGTFSMPNISPHPEDGIGDWTLTDFTRVMLEGVAPDGWLPDGRNLYPSHPYMAYRNMTPADVRDLFAYIRTLPQVEGEAAQHDLTFPFNIRRGVGLWRLAFLDGEPLSHTPSPDAAAELGVETDLLARGHYLVEGPAHCAQCHSPRTALGTIPDEMRHAGGPGPDGDGWFPNITPHETGIGFWSMHALANYLESGVSPIDISASGKMADVVHMTAQLSDRDRLAMAAYLKTVPPVRHLAPGEPAPNYTPEVVMLDEPAARSVELPVADDAAIAQAKTLHVSRVKPFHLSRDALAGDGEPAGRLISAAALEVREHDGDAIRVRLDGWRMLDADRAIYAQKGHRILEAVLGDAAVEAVETGEAAVVEATGQQWAPARLDVWIDGRNLTDDRKALWRVAAKLYTGSCGTCHALSGADAYRANQWIGNLNAMKRYTTLTDDQYRLLLAYLQTHARDTGGAGDAR